MKKQVLWGLTAFLSGVLSLPGQAQFWQDASKMEGSTGTILYNKSVDINNVGTTTYRYVTGSFNGTYNGLTSSNTDILVAKLDVSGTVIWSVKAGGIYEDVGNSITVDLLGNCYVTGYIGKTFSGTPDTAYFGGTGGGGGTLTKFETTTQTAFVAKYNSAGTFLWVRRLTTYLFPGIPIENASEALDVTEDRRSNDRIQIAGWFMTNAMIGTCSTCSISSNSGPHATMHSFVAQYDQNGNPMWATSFRSDTILNNVAMGLKNDGLSNAASRSVYVTGWFDDYIEFTNTSGGLITLTNNSGNLGEASYLAKLRASDGKCIWARKIRANNGVTAKAVTVSTADPGQPIVTGDWGGDSLLLDFSATLTKPANNFTDVFIAKYTHNGAVTWATRAGGTEWDAVDDIEINPLGNIYLTGFMEGSMDFYSNGGTYGGTSTFTGLTGGRNPWLAKYDFSGNYLWSDAIKGSCNHNLGEGTGVTLNTINNTTPGDQPIVTGSYGNDIASFNMNGPANETYLTADPMSSASYVAKHYEDNCFGGITPVYNITSVIRTSSTTATVNYMLSFPMSAIILYRPVGGTSLNNGCVTNTIPVLWFRHNFFGAASGSEFITGLTPGTIYEWYIVLVCGNGTTPINAGTLIVGKKSTLVVDKPLVPDMPVTVYPNPTRNQAVVNFGADIETPVDIVLYDVQGRELLRHHAAGVHQGQPVTLEMGHLDAGMYMVKVLNSQQQQLSVTKIMKE